MKHQNVKILLSSLSIGLLLTGCVSSSIYERYKESTKKIENKKTKKYLSDEINEHLVEDEGIPKEGLVSVALVSPDIKSLKQFVSDDEEEMYYFELIKNYVHDLSSIKTKQITKTTTVSLSEMKKEVKKQHPTLGDAQVDMMAKSIVGNKSTQVVNLIVLTDLPKNATSSLAVLQEIHHDFNTGVELGSDKNYIGVTYEYKDQQTALGAMQSISDKIENFLKHDKNWSLNTPEAQKKFYTNARVSKARKESNTEMIALMKKKISEAETNGEDATNFKNGLKELTTENKVYNNSVFNYQWYTDDHLGRHMLYIIIAVDKDNKVIFTIYKAMAYM